MIRVETATDSKGEVDLKCELDGSLEELANEAAAIINGIFNGIAEDNENPFEAAVFQAVIMEIVADYESPVWERRESEEW